MTETRRVVTGIAVDPSAYAAVARSMPLVRPGGTGELWEAQAQCLGSLALHGGVVAQLGCGDGKGLVSMLGARMLNAQRPLVLIPSKLRDTYAAEFVKFDRLGFDLPRNIEVKSHGYISRHSTYLDEYKPDYLFIDEAHAYRNASSARTERLIRYLNATPTKARGGDLAFGVASGTLVATSILDCAHLMTHAVGRYTPMPRHPTPRDGLSRELAVWARCLDPDGRPSGFDYRDLAPLVRTFAPEYAQAYDAPSGLGIKDKQRIARIAFSRRRRTSPGVIVSDAESCGVPLDITIHQGPGPPSDVQQLLDYVDTGADPLTGEPFIDDIARWRARQQLSIGCYYRWNWGNVGRHAPDERWMTERSLYNRAITREIRELCGPNYDSQWYVEEAIRADPEHRMRPRYDVWEVQKHKYKISDLQEIIMISDWYVREVVRAARAHKLPAIVWYNSQGAERALMAAGLPCFGSGSTAPKEAITCGLLMDRHGTGTNLQDRWSVAYFAEFPSSGELAEQVIARIHRPGQKASHVEIHLWTHTSAFKRNFTQARSRAEFINWAQGRQRLTYGEYH